MTEAILKIKNLKIETLNITMILSTFSLVAFYLFMANSVAMANYGKIVLQKNINALRTEIRDLNLELTDKRSISFLMKAAQDLKLVINEGMQYIKIVGPVAKNP